MIDKAGAPTPDDFLSIAEDFEWARKHYTKPEHLNQHLRRASLRAARLAFRAVTAGKSRNLCPPTLLQPPEPRSDEWCSRYWWYVLCAMSASRPDLVHSDAAWFEHPDVIRDADGVPLGTDGKPAPGRWYVIETGKPLGKVTPSTWRRRWKRGEIQWLVRPCEFARVTDGYDAADWLAHHQERAASCAACCRVLAEGVKPPATIQPSEDFAVVTWGSKEFLFTTELQRLCIKTMYANPRGVAEQTIGKNANSNARPFRLAKVFGGHPAWGTMIQPHPNACSVYWLAPPESQ
jgi:hypothetical protein